MQRDELELLTATLRDLATAHDGDALTEELDRFGWLELLETAPSVAVPALFDAQGRAGSWSSGLHDVLASELARLDPAASTHTTAVVLPRPGHAVPATIGDDGDVQLDGILLGARDSIEWVVAAAAASGSPLAVRFPYSALSRRQSRGLDARLPIVAVNAERSGVIIADESIAAAWWATTVSLGRRALSHQLCGAAAAMLDLARTHALERRQFGRVIGSFQAVRHRLADAHVALTGARAAADTIWEADDEPLASMTTKLVCGRAALVVSAHAQQVLAGIGFTAEHPYHHAMKRAVVLERILGSADQLAALVGAELVARGDAPRLVEL